jgi:hypothetical protein
MFILKFLNNFSFENNHSQHIPPTKIIEHVSKDSY